MSVTRDFSVLVGKTIVAIEGAEQFSEEIRIMCTDGNEYRMLHHQDCCENVTINDVAGDVADLIGGTVTRAEEVSSAESPPDYVNEYPGESQTWTYYKIDTEKGGVTIRWLGESNGYYSEGVNFEQV